MANVQATAEVVWTAIRVDVPDVAGDLVKQVPGSRWKKDRIAGDHFTVPLTWAACLQLRGIFGDGLTVGEKLAEWSWRQREWIDAALALRTSIDAVDPAEIHPRLDPFQAVDVAWALTVRRGLLSAPTGAGKTVVGSVYLSKVVPQASSPALVVCPKGMILEWVRHLEEWWPGCRVSAVYGTAAQRRKRLLAPADVYVIGWGSLRLHSRLETYGQMALTDKQMMPKELNRPWSAVVFDEAHGCRDPHSQQTRAAWAVADDSDRVLALTATPTDEHPDDAWGLLRLVAGDAEYPGKTKYVDRYCEVGWNQYGGMEILGINPATRDEFRSIVDLRMRRLPKAVVLPNLPPLRGGISEESEGLVVRELSMTKEQAQLYCSIRDQMIAAIQDEDWSMPILSPLAKDLRLLQACSSSFDAEQLPADPSGRVKWKVTLRAPSNKVDAVLELAEDWGNEPFVVYSPSRQLILLAQAALEKHKCPTSLLVGGQSTSERDEHYQRFVNGKSRVILLTDAGGQGFTLTRARLGVVMSRPHAYIKNVQFEGRIHRRGSEVHDAVEWLDLVSAGTVQEKVLRRVLVKHANVEEFVRDREVLLEMLSGDPVVD